MGRDSHKQEKQRNTLVCPGSCASQNARTRRARHRALGTCIKQQTQSRKAAACAKEDGEGAEALTGE